MEEDPRFGTGFNQQPSTHFTASSPFVSSQNNGSISDFGASTSSAFSLGNAASSNFGSTVNNSAQQFSSFGATSADSRAFSNTRQTSDLGTFSGSRTSVFGGNIPGPVFGVNSGGNSTSAVNAGTGFGLDNLGGASGGRNYNTFSNSGNAPSVFSFGTGIGTTSSGSTSGLSTGNTSVFGTGNSAVSSAFGTGQSTFGAGTASSGFSSTASIFGAISTGMGQSTSGLSSDKITSVFTFGTPDFKSGSGSSFGSGTSVYGSLTTQPSALTSQITMSSSGLGNPSFGTSSVFGNIPAPTSTVSPFGTTMTQAASSSSGTGSTAFTAFSKPGTSAFVNQSVTKPQGLGGSSSVFNQNAAPVSFVSLSGSSVFGASRTEASLPAHSTGNAFGSVSPPTTTASNSIFNTVAPSSTSNPFTTVPAPQPGVFRIATAPSQTGAFNTDTSASMFGNAPKPAFTFSAGSGGTPMTAVSMNKPQTSSGNFPTTERKADGEETKIPSLLGFSGSASSGSIFGGASKSPGQGFPFGVASPGSVFGDTNKAASTTFSAPAGAKPLFPSAAAVVSSAASSFTNSADPATTTAAASGNSSGQVTLFGKPDASRSTSVFGGQKSAEPHLAFGSARSQEGQSAASGLFAGKRTASGDANQGEPLSSREGQERKGGGFRSLTDGTAASGSGSMSVFGGRRAATSEGDSAGGGGWKGRGFPFPVTNPISTGEPSSRAFQSKKRSADHENESQRAAIKKERTEQLPEEPLEEERASHSSLPRTPHSLNIRRASSQMEDVSRSVALRLKNLPVELNKGSLLRAHFSKFGTVLKVTPQPAKGTAMVRFASHEEADEAKRRGSRIGKHTLTIFFASSAEKSPSSNSLSPAPGRQTWGSSSTVQAGPSAIEDDSNFQDYQLPNYVSDELNSMRGGDSRSLESVKQSAARGTNRKLQGELEGGRRQDRAARREVEGRQARSVSPLPSTSESAGSQARQPKLDSVASLRKMIATTTMEKVNILDTRDKLLRQKLGKRTGIDHQAFVGTCPDMCPEKERLYREEVRRLSVYEIIPGSSTASGTTSLVDHTRAVKEYSRSSADQDEPLPHELRPLPVLTMTMNYLLSEIADLGEDGKWAEWYDFLWNRTRSIRKEITQQQLCSHEVVELIEKCVRFHIFCSEHLCAEDMMVFDPKINNENLTKCLQTLKELYADMEVKHGQFCPNEAEFRCYIVLMNLNEGDTLREVQQLRPEIRESREISFAVKAYSALNSNNYVRFFRLVKSASFLNACSLHRYFNQIRALALHVILRSYTAGAKSVGFPLPEFTRLLSFESEDDAKEFCACYGLRIEGNELCLERMALVEPESPVPFWRAQTLVENKRTVSVGEVINGQPLLPVRLPVPQCSFDSQGRFVGSLDGLSEDAATPAEAVRVLERPMVVQPSQFEDSARPAATSSAAAAVGGPPSDLRQPENVSTEVMHFLARSLFFEVINDLAKQVAEEFVAEGQARIAATDAVTTDIVISSVNCFLREVSVEVVEDERVKRNQAAAAEHKARVERGAENSSADLICEVVREEASSIAGSVLQEARRQDAAERRERCAASLHLELLERVCGELGLQVADQVFQVEVVARLQMLADLQKAVELRRTAHWLALWRRALLLRQRQKRAMLDFPCAPPMTPASQRLRQMFPDRQEDQSSIVPSKAVLMVNDRAAVTILSPLEVEHRTLALTAHLSLASLVRGLQRSRAWAPLHLPSLVRSHLLGRVQEWVQKDRHDIIELGLLWKLLLSLPSKEEMESCDEPMDDDTPGRPVPADLLPVMSQWLQSKFTQGRPSSHDPSQTQKTVLSRYRVPLDVSNPGDKPLHLGLCVRTTAELDVGPRDKPLEREEGLMIMKGTSALLFLLPHADTIHSAKWEAARKRLCRLLEAKPPLPPIPLVLLVPCRPGAAPAERLTHQVMARLSLQAFLDRDLLSCAAVVELPVRAGQSSAASVTAPEMQNQLKEAIKYLASQAPEPPLLRGHRLSDFVEDMLLLHFFNPVLQDFRLRQQREKLHQGPNAIIGLYNSLIDHLADILTYPALQDVSWPPPELVSSDGPSQGILRGDWNSQKHLGDVYELVTNLRLPWFHYQDPASPHWSQVCQDVWTFVDSVVKKRCDSAVSLTSRISRLLARTCLKFESLCLLALNEDHCTPTYVNAPWTDIIVACIDFRLQILHNWQDDEANTGGDQQVFFDASTDDMEFEPPAAWLDALLDTEDKETHRVAETLLTAISLHKKARQDSSAAHSEPESMEESSDSMSVEEEESDGIPAFSDRNNSGLGPSGTTGVPAAQDMEPSLLQQVKEEREKSQSWTLYLDRALKEDTSFDMVSLRALTMKSPGSWQTPAAASLVLPSDRPASSLVLPSARPASGEAETAHSRLPQPGSATAPSGVRFQRTVTLPVTLSAMTATPAYGFGLTPRRPAPCFRMFSQRTLLQSPSSKHGPEEEEEDEDCGKEPPLSNICSQPLTTSIEELKENLQTQRRASEQFEKRLKSFLES